MTTPQDLQDSVNELPWDNIQGLISGEDIEGLWNQCIAIFEAMGGAVWPTIGAPSSSLGNNNDFAIDQVNKFIYGPKIAGSWPGGTSFGGGSSSISIRTVTASTTLSILSTDQYIGLNRTTSVTSMIADLPVVPGGQFFTLEDIAGNLQAFPVTVTPPAGHSIAGLPPPGFVMNQDRQSSTFRYYGSNVWSVS